MNQNRPAGSPVKGAAPKSSTGLIRTTWRKNLFWRMFFNYFLLIMIPVISASIFAQTLVVQMIEDDAERLNTAMINQSTEQTDARLQALKTNMIHTLSTSRLTGVLLSPSTSPMEREREAELLHSLREQLQLLESDDLVHKAFFYFKHRNLVIDAETFTSKTYYFSSRYPLGLEQQLQLESILTGKKMMDFIRTPQFSSFAMSYPFNSPTPEVYLWVDLKLDKLRESISIPEQWFTGTAIVSADHHLLTQSGLNPEDERWLLQQVRQDGITTDFKVAGKTGLSFQNSAFHDSWKYVSLVDLSLLMKPAYVTRIICWLFMVFFLLLGGFVSYRLSRRLYRPIAEIRHGLRSHPLPAALPQGKGNEIEDIKQYSEWIMNENKELSQMVSGMRPVLREQFIGKILQGQYRDPLSISYYAREIGIPYRVDAARIVINIAFHYDLNTYYSASESSRTFLHTELKDSIARLDPGNLWLCLVKPDVLACAVEYEAENERYPEQLAQEIQSVVEQYSEYYSATIGIGTTVFAVEQLYQSYHHAAAMLKYRGLNECVEICPSTPARKLGVGRSHAFLTVKEVNCIFNQHKAKAYGELLQSVYALLQEGREGDWAAEPAKYLFTDVLNTWIRAAESEHKEPKAPYYSDLFERVNRSMTWDELQACFSDIHGFLFPEAKGDKPVRSQQFKEILHYIHEHYDQELSIEHFASMTQMSVGHFSRTFKEEVGEKYVEYIAKYRLSRAKHFLLETNLNIDEIAERVGYWGRNSFIRAFRRYEGITPAKYRSIHQ